VVTQDDENNKENKTKQWQDNFERNPYFGYKGDRTATKQEIRKYLLSNMINDETKSLLWKSSALIVASKGLAFAGPWLLKQVVDSMTMAGAVDFTTAAIGITAFGAARAFSTSSQEYRMTMISRMI